MSEQPFVHELIRASAGAGKTYQLTNRYLGLLTAGVEPDAILATTFTRKAAGEILDRLLERLAHAAGDPAKAKKLGEDIGCAGFGQADATQLLRKLTANLHRIRVGTLDSFYIALASSFSLELGLPAGWSICEESDDEALRQQALERVLEREAAELLLALYQRLTHGHSQRGVHQELLRIIRNLYGIHQETEPAAWSKFTIAQALSADGLADLLARIEAFDLSNHAAMQKPRAEDLRLARVADWQGLLGKGLSGSVHTDKNTFRSKSIPDDLTNLYKQLICHVGALLIHPVADQTAASREFLDCFHQALWALKQAVGEFRFGEVTQALVKGAQGSAMQDEALAYRLDGAIEHLLLDEFQDTSLAQWLVLEPMARRITATPAPVRRSFFCVGDLKQAIYGWRGGITEIFTALKTWKLSERSLDVSWRSAQPIIDAVNQVFGNLLQVQAGDKNQAGLAAWSGRFQNHTTVKEEHGYVCLQSGPKQEDGQTTDDQRVNHCKYVADKIREIVQQAPGCSVGVLCRTNETVADMIYELRRQKIEASEEGGNPLTDSPAVEVILSLFTLADHPGHSIAWFHLQNSPLQHYLKAYEDADALAQHLRRELLTDGYGQFTYRWAMCLAPACDRRDLSRLQQLVDLAYDYQPRSTLRTDDFLALVRPKRMIDPSGANVRVMTIHGAKGLQFDVVVLPELDSGLTGRPPAFVVRRDPTTLAVDFVCRYADESVQRLLTPEERRAFDQNRQQRVEESLSLLYVGMTRSVYAMHLFIPGPRQKDDTDAWYNLLLATLTPEKQLNGKTVPEKAHRLYEVGDRTWYQHLHRKPSVPGAPRLTERITFCAIEADRRRAMEHVAPSRREGQSRVALDRLFAQPEGTGTAAGTLYHAWFETVTWLENGEPTDAALREAARKLRKDLPRQTWRNEDRFLASFRTWLQSPAINCILLRSAYTDTRQSGFPAALASMWKPTIAPHKVERERRFLVREGEKFWNGSLDRIVWLADAGRIVAADVIDFKTDDIQPGNAKALEERTEHYRPQLEAYRNVVARLAHLPEDHVAARMVFTNAATIVDV